MKTIAFLCFAALFQYAYGQLDGLGPCDPLVPEYCAYPFPNNFFARPSNSSVTGFQVYLTSASMPIDRKGNPILEPNPLWNQLDGFCANPAIMSYFEDMTLQNIPSHNNIKNSLLPNCPTVLMDASTSELVAHWCELDMTTEFTNKRSLMCWPSKRLNAGGRYIMAMRNIISEKTAQPIPPSSAFFQLRDNLTSTDPDVYLRQNYFNTQIFPVLQKGGIDISELQLAWDFTVASKLNITGRLLEMRRDGLARIPAGGPKYYIEEVKNNVSSYTARYIRGRYEVPLYLTTSLPGGVMVLDQYGYPVFQGWANASFNIQIPNSLIRDGIGVPGRVLQYGHGLFGNMKEIEINYFQELADDLGYVTAATDWWGLWEADVPSVVLMMLTNCTDFRIVPDGNQQGLLNQMVLSELLTTSLVNDPNVKYGGVSVINPNLINYNGNSLGGIMGSTFMSVSPHIDRGVLGVPGGPFCLLLPRSVDFDSFYILIKSRLENPFDRINILNLFQMLWDRSDPSAYVSYASNGDSLPGNIDHSVIFQYALGDAQVSWLGAETLGRSFGADMFDGNVREDGELFYGFNFTTGPVKGGGIIQGFNYTAPVVPQDNRPPSESSDTHECPRRDYRAILQMASFFETGFIQNDCAGSCNPNPPIANVANCPFPVPVYENDNTNVKHHGNKVGEHVRINKLVEKEAYRILKELGDEETLKIYQHYANRPRRY